MRTNMKWLAAIGLIMVLLLSVCAATADGVTETIGVSISTKGTPPETPETYTVRLTADGDFPMPQDAVKGEDGKAYRDLQIVGAASGNFPALTFDTVGIYTYTVRQIAGTTEGVTYDPTVYNVKVQVYNNAAGTGIESTMVIRKQGEEPKTSVAFVNTYPVELISKTVQKVWDDKDDQDGLRPDELTATLTSSEGLNQTVKLNAGNKWTDTVKDLPRFKEDTRDEITYTWQEGPVPSAYKQSAVSEDGNVTTITNSHTPETIDVSVEKIWDDADNQDGIRPKGDTTLRVILKANGQVKQTVYLKEANGWKDTVSGLPKYYNKGTPIVYTWEEPNPPIGYYLSGNATGAVKGGQLTTLKNTHVTEITSATIIKNWDDGDNQDGIRPESITVTLSEGTEVTLNADNNWRATVGKLPKFKNGKEIEYTWKEGKMPEGYSLANTSKDGTITTITNKHTPETQDIEIRKVWEDDEDWDGIRQPVTLVLTASANQTAVATYTWVVKDDATLAHTFTVPVYNKGSKLVYTVDEAEVPEGYTKTVDNSTLTVTNKHEVIPETVEIQISKTWEDDSNRDGVRPDNIVVQVMQNGKEYNTVTVTGTGNIWTYMMTGLPKYDADHKEYTYTIAEVNVPEYASEIRDFAITNTREIATTSKTVTKVWNDNNNVANRPAAVTVTLNANGTAVRTVTLNAENNWTATINDLPVNEAGKAIAYEWVEAAVPGYTLTGTATTAEGVTTLTNTQNVAGQQYRLRIFYRYTNGRQAAATVTEWHNAGDQYTHNSPRIAGYTASRAVVAGTMPARNHDEIVIYAPGGNFEIIVDYETPLGLGNVYLNIGECIE